MNAETAVYFIPLAITCLFLGAFLARQRFAGVMVGLRQELQALSHNLDNARAELVTKVAELRSVEMDCNTLQTEVAVVRQRVTSAEAQAVQQAQELAEARQRVSELQSAVSEKDREVASLQGNLDGARRQAEERAEQLQSLREELKEQRQLTAQAERERSEVSERLAALRTSQEERDRHHAEQLEQFEESKRVLKVEFQNLAQQILEAKGKAFTEQSRQSLDALLSPFREQINEFKSKVETVHLEGTKQQTEMRSELKQLQNLHQRMSQEAHDLATALKGQKKMQGNWGELILENVLDRSGLQLGRDYKREVSFTTEDGGRSRPDAVVYLPREKHLVIDAKVSLNAYTRYVNSEDKVERQQALKEHVEAVAARIRELADRDYYKLPGLNSPEMVFMFIPIESAFVEALKADESLFQKAIEQNVLVATPTTLLTSLNIVRQLWRFEDQNKHTAELAGKAEKVFKKLKTFLTSFEGVKKGLDRASEAYAKAEGQLVSGPGNLVKQVTDFKQLAPSIRDQLPEYFTEKAELELSYLPADEKGAGEGEMLLVKEGMELEAEHG